MIRSNKIDIGINQKCELKNLLDNKFLEWNDTYGSFPMKPEDLKDW